MSLSGGLMLGLLANEAAMPSPESETKSRNGVVAGDVDRGGVGIAVGLDVLDRVQGDVPDHIAASCLDDGPPSSLSSRVCRSSAALARACS